MMLLNPEKTKRMVKQLDKSISVLCLLLISCWSYRRYNRVQSIATLVSLLRISLKGKPTLTVLLTQLLTMCICYLVSGTFLTLKHVEHSFMHKSCLEQMMSLTHGTVGVTHIKKHICTQTCSQSSSCGFTNVTGRGHTSADPLPLKQHLQYNECILVHKVVHNKAPAYLRELLHAETSSSVKERNSFFCSA